MMTCLINLSSEFEALATRKTGQVARERLIDLLSDDDRVTIDFGLSSISPSFADEFIGILAKDMGLNNFKSKVKLVNVSDSSKTIIRHVLNKRLAF